MFETWDEHIGIFSVFIHTTYYPHAVLTQARIITMQQYDNNAPEPKHEIDHPNASLDSSCFPLTSFLISPFTLPSLVFSPLSMFRDLNSPHCEAIHASSYTHLFPPRFYHTSHHLSILRSCSSHLLTYQYHIFTPYLLFFVLISFEPLKCLYLVVSRKPTLCDHFPHNRLSCWVFLAQPGC
jgi:hypothetical protein